MAEYDTIINNTYRIISPIGNGGMGIIYLAEHLHLRKMVVLKKIKSEVKDAVTVRAEADILKSLHHMYLPQVYDFFEYCGQIYTVIDYIDGVDLKKYLDGMTVIPEECLVKWMSQLCDALGYLHSRKPMILHNDIKPANIIINSDDDVCLIDFNVSTEAEDIVKGYTMEYTSPEQYYSALALKGVYAGYVPPLTESSDLYSLGATFYALVAHFPPNVYNVITGTQPLLSQYETGYSEGFCKIIDKLMRPDPQQRYASAAELKKALASLKKQDIRYKKYLVLQLCSVMLTGIMIIMGVWLISLGVNETKIEKINNSYSEVSSYYRDGEYKKALSSGKELLSDSDWKKYSEDSEKVKLYYIIGMCYYNNTQYESAVKYIEKAVELEQNAKSRGNYELDEAVAYAYNGDFDLAEDYLNKAQQDGADSNRIYTVQSQIYYAKGEYSSVTQRYTEFDFTSADEYTVKTMAEIAGDSYSELGDYENAVLAYEKSYQTESGITIERKTAAAYLNYVEQGDSSGIKIQRLKKAEEYYGLVNSYDYRTLEDVVNYCRVYRLLGDYSGALDYYKTACELLENAKDEFSDNYIIYQQLAISYYKAGMDDKAKENCRTALQLYDSTPQSDKESKDSNDMQNLYQLKEKYSIN